MYPPSEADALAGVGIGKREEREVGPFCARIFGG